MFRRNVPTITLAICLASWLAISLASLNAQYKTEVNLAPFVRMQAPNYWEFLNSKGVSLISFFFPYDPNPIVLALGMVGSVLFFSPAIAAYLASHAPVRWLSAAVALFLLYAAIDVLISYPAADRNGCESCDNVVMFEQFLGAILLFIAVCSRAIYASRRNDIASKLKN